jgi:hypothetical protein
MKRTLDPRDLKALLRQGDPARELDAGQAERVRRAVVVAVGAAGAVRRPTPSGPAAARLRWDLRLALATASVAVCAAALVIGLEAGPRTGSKAESNGEAPASPMPAPRRVQIDFATPGGTRIVWTLLRGEPGARRSR